MELVNLSLKENLMLIENQILKLQRLKEILDEAQQLIDQTGEVKPEIQIMEKQVKKIKPVQVKKEKPVKLNKSKKGLGFSKILAEILSENSDKSYDYDTLVKLMERNIEKGYVEKPAKSVRDYISTLVYNYHKNGKIMISKSENGRMIQWIDSNKMKESVSNLSLLEDTIMECFRKHPKLIHESDDVADKIRFGNNYIEIARTLRGELKKEVSEVLQKLVKSGLLKEEEEGFMLNEK